MYAEVHIDGGGYSCYCCNKAPDHDVFHFPDLPIPYSWICSKCLATAMMDGQLTIGTEAVTVCNNCSNSVNGTAYCDSCYEAHYEAGRESGFEDYECEESHGCHWCGDTESVYCYEHAKSEFALVSLDELECFECTVVAAEVGTTHWLCEDCFTKVSSPDVTYAQAAEPIDVEWDDE